MNGKQSKTISLEDVLELYKQALEETALVIITDAEGRITYANEGLCTLTGYSSEELLSGHHPILPAGPEARPLNQQLWKTIKSGKTWRGTIVHQKKDGSPLFLKTTIFPFPGAPREPFQFLTVATSEAPAQQDALTKVLTRGLNVEPREKKTDPPVEADPAGQNPGAANPAPHEEPQPEVTPPMQKDLKVLVAADLGVNRMVISKFLEKSGIAFDAAGDGLSVLNKLQHASYHLIVMDMKMPILDGYNTLKAIRRQQDTAFHDLPVIALSTSPQSDATARCLAAGADDFLTEPFAMEDLNRKIHKLVTGKRKTQNMETQDNNSSTADQQPLYNLEYLEQLSEGDQEFTTSMIRYFIDNAPGVLDSMKENYQQKDWEALRNVAHKFKPQLNFMGINSVLEEVENIEQDAFKQQNLDRLPGNIEKTDRVCREAIEQLKVKLEDYS